MARCTAGATGESQETTASTVVLNLRGFGASGGRKSSAPWPSMTGRRRGAGFLVCGFDSTRGGAYMAMGTTFDCAGNSCCCTPRIAGRGACCAFASECNGCSLAASAPSVRIRVNSPLSVSPGLRPHFRQRVSFSWLRAPQKLQVILEKPTASAPCATFALLGLQARRLLPFLNTPVPLCHGKSSSNTYVFPLTVLVALMLGSTAFSQEPPQTPPVVTQSTQDVTPSAQMATQIPPKDSAASKDATAPQTTTHIGWLLPDRKTLLLNE